VNFEFVAVCICICTVLASLRLGSADYKMSPFVRIICVILAVVCLLMWFAPSSHVLVPPHKSRRPSSSSSTAASSIGDRDRETSIADVTDDKLLQQQHEEMEEISSGSSGSGSGRSASASSAASSVASVALRVDAGAFLPAEYALVLYDSRPLKEGEYWLAAAAWNRKYCEAHGHTFVYYALPAGAKCMSADLGTGSEPLADAWCKVRAMMQASKDFPHVRIFIYMDSDAVINRQFEHVPLSHMLTTLQTKLSWDPDQRPMVFNQDGPCWWCNQVKRVGYEMCLNAGTVLWYQHPQSLQILQDWWGAALDSYEGAGNPFRRKFRLKWPWEQDRQMAIYHRDPGRIQVASQPNKSRMDITAGHDGWCLSHLSKSACFIAHHCEDKRSKSKMNALYSAADTRIDDIKVNYL